MTLLLCAGRGGHGDHAAGGGISRDPLRVAPGGLAGGAGVHSECHCSALLALLALLNLSQCPFLSPCPDGLPGLHGVWSPGWIPGRQIRTLEGEKFCWFLCGGGLDKRLIVLRLCYCRLCLEVLCGAPTSPCSPPSLRPMDGSSSCAAWWAAGWQECHRGERAHTHTHTRTHTLPANVLLLQLCAEDGVHPGQVSSSAAAAGLGEFDDGCDWLRQWVETKACSPVCVCVFVWPQIFWMLGSMLIIVLGMFLVPTLGWRWMIRLSVTPSIVLVFLFKVTPPGTCRPAHLPAGSPAPPLLLTPHPPPLPSSSSSSFP